LSPILAGMQRAHCRRGERFHGPSGRFVFRPISNQKESIMRKLNSNELKHVYGGGNSCGGGSGGSGSHHHSHSHHKSHSHKHSGSKHHSGSHSRSHSGSGCGW
jgi:hypothetical protein